ncbi:MAG TPA: hypothetical protein VLF43_00710 [Candidatus Saccharimonadales bacterium]|nr:hypothetical protein [Candidatus Saccharimonadales bacterium]
MGVMDDLKDKASDVMDDPDKKAQIEQMAKEKGMSIDEAKRHFMDKDKQSE